MQLGGVYRNLPDLVKQAETGSLNEGAKGDGFLKSPMAPFETTESADRKEYMALQNIPQFGVHAFYAIASEPLHEWKRNGQIFK